MTILTVHILASLVSYTLFCVASVAALLYLHHEKRIKTKQVRFTSPKKPSLSKLDTILLLSIVGGFILLSIGLPTGLIVLASKSGGENLLSMRLLLPGVVWSVYFTLLMLRISSGIRGRKLAKCTVYGACCAAFSSLYEMHAVLA